MSNPITVVFLSNDPYRIRFFISWTKRPIGAFNLRIEDDARTILEETDFEDPLTAIFLDMKHPQSLFVLQKLHHLGITQKLPVVVLCSEENTMQDYHDGRVNGAPFIFKWLGDAYEVFSLLLKRREERGLA